MKLEFIKELMDLVERRGATRDPGQRQKTRAQQERGREKDRERRRRMQNKDE